jgi:hypothetical protein
MNSDSIDKAFTDAVNEAGDLCENDHMDECIEKARALPADPAIP